MNGFTSLTTAAETIRPCSIGSTLAGNKSPFWKRCFDGLGALRPGQAADRQRPIDPKSIASAGGDATGKHSRAVRLRNIGCLIILAGIVGVSILYQIGRSFSLSTQAEPAFTPTLTSESNAPQVLNFVNGVAEVKGTAGFNQPQSYMFLGAQTQSIRVQLSSQPAGANFEVASLSNDALYVVYKSFADPSLDWSYVLSASQDYVVTVNSVTPVVYTLTVTFNGGSGAP